MHCTFLVTCAVRLVLSAKAGKECRFVLAGIAVVIEDMILAVDADVRLTGSFEDRVVVFVVDLVAAMIVLGGSRSFHKHFEKF